MTGQAAIPIYAIVPAAGLGRRMGYPKQTLPYGNSTVAGTIVQTLLDVELNGVMVVTQRELASAMNLPSDPRVRMAFNDRPDTQMIDSVRIGLSSWFDGPTDPVFAAHENREPTNIGVRGAGVLVVPGDMPGLSVDACRLCVGAFREAPTQIVVAICGGRRGHPMIFPAELRTHVDHLRGGLNLLAKHHSDRVKLVETRDPATLLDVDTWEQYSAQTTVPEAEKRAVRP